MSAFRNSEETSVILSVIMKRANVSRVRISDKTIKFISGRKRLKGAFRLNLNDDIAEFGFLIVELDSGGQAIIKVSALEAAKSITAKKVLTEQELKDLKKGNLNINLFRKELGNDDEEDIIE